LGVIEQLPDDASLEDIIYELYVRQRIERGLQQSEKGETVSHGEVMRDVARWLQSAGR
jgi:predicted transcriptional regulator